MYVRKGLILVVTGDNGTGKTTLAKTLANKHNGLYLSTSNIICERYGLTKTAENRERLRMAGNALSQFDPNWIVNAIPTGKYVVVVDGIRNYEQLVTIRAGKPGWEVIHIHYSNPLDVCVQRVQDRDNVDLLTAQLSVMNGIEDIEFLRSVCDVTTDEAYEVSSDRVDVLIGGQYGSEGKGNVISCIAKEYDWVVRTGGPNAGHKVKCEDGYVHTYFHIPSCILHSEAKAYLDDSMLINEQKLDGEIELLEQRIGIEALKERLHISPAAFLISDEHKEIEQALRAGIGSTAQGVGAATADRVMRKNMQRIAHAASDRVRRYISKDGPTGRILLEGTQGYGLDLHHSHYPYCTSRSTGVLGFMSEVGFSPGMLGRVIGVFRTHPIRVESPADGTSGPMYQEISWETVSRESGIPIEELVKTETTSTTKRKRRVGRWDWNMFERTMTMNSVDDVVVTFADYLGVTNREAKHWDQLTEEFRKKFGPLNPCMVSVGFGPEYMIDRRDQVFNG